MPNHVTNRFIVDGDPEKVEAFFAAIKGDPEVDRKGKTVEMLIDFSKIVPVPPDIFQGDLTMEMEQQTKGRNWYDWNIENWGTKWNAYSYKRNGNTLCFETAWSHPEPVIHKIAEQFPDIIINYAYADEDLGQNLGVGLIKDGKVEMEYPEEGSTNARRLALEIKGVTPEHYGLDPVTLRYKEEE